MGLAKKNRAEFVSVIPEDIQNVFEIGDVPMFFEYMEKTFKLAGSWQAAYKDKLENTIKAFPDEEVFFRFLKEEIEPALFHITQKRDIIFTMSRYLLKPRIEQLARERSASRNYYSNRR